MAIRSRAALLEVLDRFAIASVLGEVYRYGWRQFVNLPHTLAISFLQGDDQPG
jgi:hypothetical protein